MPNCRSTPNTPVTSNFRLLDTTASRRENRSSLAKSRTKERTASNRCSSKEAKEKTRSQTKTQTIDILEKNDESSQKTLLPN